MSSETQTVTLDAYPDTPLDSFPDALQRVPLATTGLDGLTDAMASQLRSESYDKQDRTDGVWRKVGQ